MYYVDCSFSQPPGTFAVNLWIHLHVMDPENGVNSV